MKTVDKQFRSKVGEDYIFPLPVLCPHCAAVCDPIIKAMGKAENICVLILSANCCRQPFYAFYSEKFDDTKKKHSANLLTVYPESISHTFPDLISSLSPRFVSLYNQAFAAEQRGHLDLAGTGYRNALEILIKDFAIKFKGADSDKVSKQTLRSVIDEYYPFHDATGLAHVSRILGNDYTHYEQKYSETDFSVFKVYVDGAIHFVYLHLLANTPLAQK